MRPVCPCRRCDPLLWTQAHSDIAKKNKLAANVLALLAHLVERALHPGKAEENGEMEERRTSPVVRGM